MRANEFTESTCNCGCSKCLARAKARGEPDIELDEKATAKLCRSTKKLGNSDQCSCVSQGLRPHASKGKGHTDGHGKYVKGHKAKSVQYGGAVKDYDGK
jgi:hypothetical protein